MQEAQTWKKPNLEVSTARPRLYGMSLFFMGRQGQTGDDGASPRRVEPRHHVLSTPPKSMALHRTKNLLG